MGITFSKEGFNSNNGDIIGDFHYKVMVNGSGNIYKYPININLYDDRENIVQTSFAKTNNTTMLGRPVPSKMYIGPGQAPDNPQPKPKKPPPIR